MVEASKTGVMRGLWALALALAACPSPQAPDSGMFDSGTHPIVPGLCSDAGLCPAGQYCQSLIIGCSGEGAVAVPSGQPGNCYLDHPCPELLDGGSLDCTDAPCDSDFDCGLIAGSTTVGLTCLDDFCEGPGQGTGGSGGSSGDIGGDTGGGSGGGQTLCPRLPVPCPDGCANFAPIYGCPVCLCSQCPIVTSDAGVEDAGVEDAGPADAGQLDAGSDGGPDAGGVDGGLPDGGLDGGLLDGGPVDGGSDGGKSGGR